MTADVRLLPRSLAAVVADLELTEASYVTLDQIREIAERHGVASSPADLAWRLKRNGWLLATSRRGVWEFAPGAHAGPYGRGDVFTVLRGELDLNPGTDLRVGLLSALWLRGWAERPPTAHELSAPPDARVSAGLRRSYRVHRFDARLPADRLRDLPVEATATTLVHIAARPAKVSSWETVEHGLVELAAATNAAALRTELADRPASVGARLGYLLHGAAPDLVAQAGLAPANGVTWFGPRRGREVLFDPTWNVADSLLPFNPAAIAPNTASNTASNVAR
jgi:hypothetical protein